jgi:uncharacterized integral membrane protein (TIGR00698 family)
MARKAALSRSGNPYENPDLAASFDSMEGLPEWVDPTESPAEKAGRSPWQAIGNRGFETLGGALPGLALALSLAVVGTLGADWIGMRVLGFDKTPLSPILVAILLGLAIRNTIGLPSVYEPGLQLALKKILRIGVALLGIRLSFTAAGAIGLVAIPIVFVCIASALVFVTWVNRALGLPSGLGTLVAVGTAICGNTAIVAMAPIIGAKDDEVSYAVGCVTVFGLLALVGYPYLSEWLFAGDAQLAGFFLGTAIHDTAQVAGAGMVYLQQFGTDEALNTATVTKLIRNMFMLGVIPLVAYMHHRSERSSGGGPRLRLSAAFPLFVLGFVAMTLLRTLGDVVVVDSSIFSVEVWENVIATTGKAASWCLIIAMASVGLGTSFSRLKTLGLKPLVVGLVAATLLGLVSYAMIQAVAPWASSLSAVN